MPALARVSVERHRGPRASSLERAFDADLARRARRALVEFVAERPELTLEDLAELVARTPELGGMTLSELLGALRSRMAGVIEHRIVLNEAEWGRLHAILDGKIPPPAGLQRTLATMADPTPLRVRWTSNAGA
jgi:hypothetical protein